MNIIVNINSDASYLDRSGCFIYTLKYNILLSKGYRKLRLVHTGNLQTSPPSLLVTLVSVPKVWYNVGLATTGFISCECAIYLSLGGSASFIFVVA